MLADSHRLTTSRLRRELPFGMLVVDRVTLPDDRECYRPTTGFERLWVRWDDDREGYVLAGEHEAAIEVVHV